MRIADSQLYAHARRHGGAARSNVVAASDRLSSGYRVRGPSDDVTAFALASRHQTVAKQSANFERVTARAQGEVQAADSALSGVVDSLIDAKALAVQFANDTQSTSARANAANVVVNLREAVTSALNREHGGRFIFGGTQSDAPPFDSDGNFIGDNVARRIEIAPGVTEEVSLAPESAFLGANGGANIFAVLQDLEAALLSDDSAQIRATFDGLQVALDDISNARSTLGGHANVLASAEAAHIRMQESARIAASNESEQDLIVGASDLAQAQNALDATLTAAAKTFELSLLDRLR